LVALGSTTYAYFVTYAREPMTGYWFERASVALAGDVNGFLGEGWDGARMVRGGDPDRRAYVDSRLWREWPQVRFLVAAPARLILDTAPRPTPGPVAAFAWPYEDWRWTWDVLPHPAEIEVEEGPLSQGDRDPAPYTTYVGFYATPADPASAPLARFSGGVELLGAMMVPRGEGFGVQLRWRAAAPLAEDYTIFVHYLRDGARVAQADARPARGYYPTTEWRAGDVIRDLHPVPDVAEPLPGRDVVRVGFWQAESGQILYLLDAAGNPAGDWIDLPVEALDVRAEAEGF
jgi:hypothetical protein